MIRAARRSGLLLGLLVFASAQAAAQAPKDLADLTMRGEQYVDPETSTPYNGEVVGWVAPGLVRESGMLRDGRWHGEHRWFHINGQLATKDVYEDGRLQGESEAYFKTGELSARETYRNGRLDGPYESWWVRGRLAERGSWTQGSPCGEWVSFGRPLTYPDCPAG